MISWHYSFSKHVAPDFVGRSEIHLKVYQCVVAKHSSSRSSPPKDLLSHINVSMVSFLQSLLLLFHFCLFLSQLSELVWKLAEEISLQLASKCFQSFSPPANGNKRNAKKSRFCQNRNLTGTLCHWFVILRSFSVVLNPAKRDANGFFKVLLLFSHLLISRHPVQKSKFGACAVTGYSSFKLPINKEVEHELQASVSITFFLNHILTSSVIYYILNRRTAAWNLFVLYNK